MIVVEKSIGLVGKPRNLKKFVWIAAFVGGAGAAAIGLYRYHDEGKASTYSEPAAIYCPSPCVEIIVNGKPRCVYPDNHTKSCP
ncbi:MAG: hypothetical protein H6R26_630 [Proteobacteria bacterium]|nr:hypothetical protein [Pseudomonadota bacterium]